MDLLRKEVCKSLQERVLHPVAKEGQLLVQEVTDDHSAVAWLFAVIDLAHELQSRSENVFHVEQVGKGYVVLFMKGFKGLERWFVSVVKNAPPYIKKSFPYHDFDPMVLVFFERLRQHPQLSILLDQIGVPKPEEDAVSQCTYLNDFFNEYRSYISSEIFKTICSKTKRTSLKNFKGMMKYVDKLFELRARLLVVRVDLYYPSYEKNTSESGREVSVEKVVNDRQKFFKSLSDKGFSEYLIGHCWKLEYASKKGFHYHCMFFFDGAKVREGVTLGRLIGEVWEGVTGYSHVYRNCNAYEKSYKHPGIGMVSYDDETRHIGLNRAINYLTKPDYFLRLSEKKVGDTFGKMKVRLVKNKSGRPRVGDSGSF